MLSILLMLGALQASPQEQYRVAFVAACEEMVTECLPEGAGKSLVSSCQSEGANRARAFTPTPFKDPAVYVYGIKTAAKTEGGFLGELLVKHWQDAYEEAYREACGTQP